MKRVVQIVRYLFAVFFIISGLGYFLGFMPVKSHLCNTDTSGCRSLFMLGYQR